MCVYMCVVSVTPKATTECVYWKLAWGRYKKDTHNIFEEAEETARSIYSIKKYLKWTSNWGWINKCLACLFI